MVTCVPAQQSCAGAADSPLGFISELLGSNHLPPLPSWEGTDVTAQWEWFKLFQRVLGSPLIPDACWLSRHVASASYIPAFREGSRVVPGGFQTLLGTLLLMALFVPLWPPWARATD